MSTSPVRLLYACRDNETFSLFPGDGEPRAERYCRSCIPLRDGCCCLLSGNQIDRRLRTLELAPPARPICVECHKPNKEPRFKNCPRCRAKARARMRGASPQYP